MIYLYAIANDLSALPEVEGIDRAELQRRRAGELDLVVSEHTGEVEPTEEAVLAHARVVEGVLPLADAVLPTRFGVAFEDGTRLEQAVGDRSESLAASLERVRGRVELGVRVIGSQEPQPADTGRAYLEARRRQAAEIDRLHEALASRSQAAARGSSVGQLVLSGAYLVEPDGIDDFRETVGVLESKHPDLTFALTGPWPPYSFAGMGEP